MDSLYLEYQDRGVQIWAISEEELSVLEGFRDAFGLSLPILHDSSGAVSRIYDQQSAFRSAAYPREWIIDPEGNIAYMNNRFEREAIEAVLDQLLAE